MNTIDFDSLFNPIGVAVYGASGDPTKLGGRPVRNLIEQGYPHGIYPINPKHDEIQGLKAYKRVCDIGKRVDACVIMLKAEYILDAVKDCAAAGVKLGVILSSGFGEVGPAGKQMQKEVTEYALSHGMRLIGPNCLGVVNFKEKVPLTFSVSMLDKAKKVGDLAICSQSGAFGSHLYGLSKELGIDYSYWFTTGNEADIQLNDCLKYLSGKEDVKSVAAYMEDARDGGKLLDALEACRKTDTPVTLLKVGKSERGSKAAASHTGALAGNAAVYEAVFKQKNVIPANDVYELLDFASFSAAERPVGQGRIAVVTVSGGVGVLHIDKCEELGLKPASMSEETKEKIRSVIPAFGSAENPIDITAQTITRENGLVAPLSYAMEDENVDIVVMYLAMYKKDSERIVKQFIEVYDKYKKPLVVTWMAGPKDGIAKLREHGIQVFEEPVRALKAIAAVCKYKEKQEKYHRTNHVPCELNPLDMCKVSGVRNWLLERGKLCKSLSEGESRKVLEAFGFPVVEGGIAEDAEAAVVLAREIGYPVVMKIDSPFILHKSDVGGVVLGIGNDDEARDAYDTIMRNVSSHFDTLPLINGVLVEKMEKAQVEALLGAQSDPLFGPTIAFGMGGIFVELLKEVSLRVAPLSEYDAHEMVDELRVSKLFDGLRGKPPCDKEAVYGALLALSRMVTEMRDIIKEVDINPLFVYEKGVKAGDALIVLK